MLRAILLWLGQWTEVPVPAVPGQMILSEKPPRADLTDAASSATVSEFPPRAWISESASTATVSERAYTMEVADVRA